jgi:hypothetical protein
VAILMPAGWFAAKAGVECATSMEELNRAMAIWIAAVLLLAPVVFRGFGFAWPAIGMSALAQLLLAGMVAVALLNMDVGLADRWRQKRTMADMRTIAERVEAYKSERGTFPQAASVVALRTSTNRPLPLLGACGQRDLSNTTGPVSPRGDLVMKNGRFVSYYPGYEPQPRV